MQKNHLELEDDISADSAADAILIVSQNNEKEMVKIKQVNDEAAKMLSFNATELEGIALQDILGKDALEALDEYLEYDDEAPDLEYVLKRVSNFTLKSADGAEQKYALKILRDQARDQNQWFRLILKDERRQIEDDSLIATLRQSMDGVKSIDEKTGFPDHNSAKQYIDMTQRYIQSHDLSACFAVLRIDRFDKSVAHYGKEPCVQLLKHVASCCKTKFRSDDVVCRLSDHTVGLILYDISFESARVVLNRLRWFIQSHRISFGGKPNFSVTVSLAFTEIKKDDERDILSVMEESIAAIDSDERNLLVELDS